jgi:predicted enzyme related to lactoylglutathione lyase
MRAKFIHINMIAADWRKLVQFYLAVFDCKLVPPEAEYSGSELDRATGLKNAQVAGVHLRLPGYDDDGPLLEIYSYGELKERPETEVNRPGYGHLAFQVFDIEATRRAVLLHGGRALGELVTTTTASGKQVTWCYMTDPEGNIVELEA